MPIEILETIANINYNTPRPRPIDPASFFDLVKVRRLVDEATNLAVRAASDIASPTLTSVNGGFLDSSSMFSLQTGGSIHGAKLSRERKFRMREQASQKLARAYRLDEIACSVATMQGASPLEEVGSSVLHRNPRDSDAKYVHFFHEKIPSRQLAESTSLQPLTDIISDRPGEPEVLRTRATVKIFKDDLEGAAQDLTSALSVCRFHQPSPAPSQEVIQVQDANRPRRRAQDVLAEKDQPSSLEGQLLFQRASVYLTMACNHVSESLPSKDMQSPQSHKESANGIGQEDTNGEHSSNLDKEANKKKTEARKMVKTLAKRAMRDYMTFISRFEYSPNLPVRVVTEFNERTNNAAHGTRNPRLSEVTSNVVYKLSDLFAAIAPFDLPPFPSEEVVKKGSSPLSPATTCEWATYHPLLADALHSLLHCHCLVQTSSKELQRHAYMVARIVRLADGYPIFQASRSPARADWIEVLRRAGNWIDLSSNWETLCTPAPLPGFDPPAEHKPAVPNPELAASAAAALIKGVSAETAQEELRKVNVREQAIREALDDERVTDEASFRAAIFAREKRAQEEHNSRAVVHKTITNGAPRSNGCANVKCGHHQPESQLKRWSGDDAREYPILTERASCIALWIKEVPVVTGTAKRKKRTRKGSSSKPDEVAVGVGNLDLEGLPES